MARRQREQQDGPAPPTRPTAWVLLGAAAVAALQLATVVGTAAAAATTASRGSGGGSSRAWGHRRALAGGFVPQPAAGSFWGSRDSILGGTFCFVFDLVGAGVGMDAGILLSLAYD